MIQSGNQAYLNAVAVSKLIGTRGGNPYACPNMGNPDISHSFPQAMAQRFFAPIIWTYVREAVVAGMAGPASPRNKFINMVTRTGVLWQGFNTYPLPLPVNDSLYVSNAALAKGGPTLPAGHVTASLSGLGEVPALVVIPGSGGIKGYPVGNGQYVIPGNTNGHPVDVINWIWWAYVNGKVTCTHAWGSSANLKMWGAPFKGYSSLIDKIAPPVIEAVVIAGVTYGFASAGAAGASSSGAGAEGGSTAVEATPASAYTPAAASGSAAPTVTAVSVPGSTLTPIATAGGGAAATGVAAGGSAGTSLASGAATAAGVVKDIGGAVVAATGLKAAVSGQKTGAIVAPGSASGPPGGLSKLVLPALGAGLLTLIALFS